MTTHEITHTEGPTVGERLQHVVTVSAARVAAVWRAVQNRRAVGRLAEWDDRMLRDVGLTRGDVHAALAGRVAEDPSKRLDVLSSERRSAVRARRREEAVRRRLGGLEI
jgi:uncharacterized protein YjiS (DUF1127 family)